MKTADIVAEEIGVSPLDIQKRLNSEFTWQFSEHIEERDGCVYFDAEVEEFLKLLFNKSSKKDENEIWRRYVNASDEMVSEVKEPSADILSEASTKSFAEDEAALTNSNMQLPVIHWTQLPVVQTISLPLNYRPDLLVQAVKIQRQEINEFLNQFDQIVDQIVPSDEWSGLTRATRNGKLTRRKVMRVVGTTIR